MDIGQIKLLLQEIQDPISGQSVVQAGLIEKIEILDDKIVNVSVGITPNRNAYKGNFMMECTSKIKTNFPESEVNIHFIANAAPQTAPDNLPQVRNIIAVGSGKGGVGKSTVSVNIAIALKQIGARVGILDADVYGPSIPTMLGLVGHKPKLKDIMGKPKMVPIDYNGIQTMSIGYIIEPEQAVVLRGPRLAGVIKQFIQECIWEELDYLIIDLPPGTGDVHLTLVQTLPVTGAVIVTTPQQVALSDAIKAANMFQLSNVEVPILGIVENMSWFTPEELPDNKYFLFGEGGGKKLAHQFNTLLLGQIPLIQGIREGGDNGAPMANELNSVAAKYYLDVAKNLMRQVAIRNEMLAPTKVVSMKS
ncbi:MAG: Mrp/NBP35 family ATP-binding protein [Saprospiraceae bacterium]|nr:Mrp/NBP35 family ATP-binding protein [Saprospiraceae bacterium]